MKMHDSNDQNLPRSHPLDQSIGKPCESATARSRRELLPGKRMRSYPSDGNLDFLEEFLGERRRNLAIIISRTRQFFQSNRQKPVPQS
jgi:hypothetical protein